MVNYLGHCLHIAVRDSFCLSCVRGFLYLRYHGLIFKGRLKVSDRTLISWLLTDLINKLSHFHR